MFNNKNITELAKMSLLKSGSVKNANEGEFVLYVKSRDISVVQFRFIQSLRFFVILKKNYS